MLRELGFTKTASLPSAYKKALMEGLGKQNYKKLFGQGAPNWEALHTFLSTKGLKTLGPGSSTRVMENYKGKRLSNVASKLKTDELLYGTKYEW